MAGDRLQQDPMDAGTGNPERLDRRTVLRALSLLAAALGQSTALVGCAPLDRLEVVPKDLRPRHFIDIHCHILNASDQPLTGFVTKVALQDSRFAIPLDKLGIVAAITAILENMAPTGDEEFDTLRPLSRLAPAPPSRTADKLTAGLERLTRTYDKRLPQAGTELLRKYVAVRARLARLDEDALFDPAQLAGILQFQVASPVAPPDMPHRLTLREALSLPIIRLHGALTIFKYLGEGPTATSLRTLHGRIDASGAGDYRASLAEIRILREAIEDYDDQLARIVRRILYSRVWDVRAFGLYGRDVEVAAQRLGRLDKFYWAVVYALRWAAGFMRYRYENGVFLAEMFPGDSGAENSRRIYVFMMEDFDYWLDENAGTKDAEARTPINRQAEVYSEITKKDFGRDNLFLGFAAFDPLRAVLARRSENVITEHPLIFLERAITTQGFVGSKIYPPMGFFAYHNRGKRFGPTIKTLLERRDVKRYKIKEEDLGRLIDDELLEFYKFCITHDIAVATHTSGSQNSFPEARERADPHYWKHVLDLKVGDKSLQTLRLNLGHVGGIWCLGKVEPGDLHNNLCRPLNADETADKLSDPRLMETWAAATVDMLVATKGDGRTYPNLYADISDFTYVANPFDVPRRDLARTNLQRLLTLRDADKRVFDYLVYGTDWSMLGRDVGYEDYVRGFIPYFYRIALHLKYSDEQAHAIAQKLMWLNNATYLGIRAMNGKKPKNRQRLEHFHHGNHRVLELLAALDEVGPMASV